ncbi:MAG: polyamine aminopropyltransferase [Burkholderiales bacterium]|nr:polyamine aminopropyltransferase [Burkholderiales bacterium]
MGLLRRLRPADEGVHISEEDGIRYLHLGSDTIQSGMRMSDPTELVLSYTRSMLAFLLFMPRPSARLVNIGLGGGSLAKWIHLHLRDTQQLVVEINPRVIACARMYFHLPPDDARLKVLEGDGAAWVASHPGCCDAILVDGYDGRAQATELSSDAFYAAAAAALNPGGILVVNLWGNDRRFDSNLQRIQRHFDGRVCCVPAAQRGNVVVLAFRDQPLATRWQDLKARADALQTLYGIEFPDIVGSMKTLNPYTAMRLMI